jgi:hypothetical protein
MVSERRLLKWAVLKEWTSRQGSVTLASQSLILNGMRSCVGEVNRN